MFLKFELLDVGSDWAGRKWDKQPSHKQGFQQVTLLHSREEDKQTNICCIRFCISKLQSFPVHVLSFSIVWKFHELGIDICLSEIDQRLTLNLSCLYFGLERKQMIWTAQLRAFLQHKYLSPGRPNPLLARNRLLSVALPGKTIAMSGKPEFSVGKSNHNSLKKTDNSIPYLL